VQVGSRIGAESVKEVELAPRVANSWKGPWPTWRSRRKPVSSEELSDQRSSTCPELRVAVRLVGEIGACGTSRVVALASLDQPEDPLELRARTR